MDGYHPRAVSPLPLWTAGPVQIKPYVICAPGRVPDPVRISTAKACLSAALPPEIAVEGGADGLGFAILHLGEHADWLLADWWVSGDSLAQRLWRADRGGAGFTGMAPRPLVACVWELAVICAERSAWVRAMMGPVPDPAAYLADRLPPGTC